MHTLPGQSCPLPKSLLFSLAQTCIPVTRYLYLKVPQASQTQHVQHVTILPTPKTSSSFTLVSREKAPPSTRLPKARTAPQCLPFPSFPYPVRGRGAPQPLQSASSSLSPLPQSRPRHESLGFLHYSLWQRQRWFDPIVHFSPLSNRTNFRPGVWPIGINITFSAFPLQLTEAMAPCYKR